MKHNQFFFAILLASVSVPCSFAQELRLRTDNIDEIVAAMTLEEKAHLLVGADDEVGERGNIVRATYKHAKAQTWKVNNVMAPNDRYKTAVTTIAPQSGVVSGLEHVIGVE